MVSSRSLGVAGTALGLLSASGVAMAQGSGGSELGLGARIVVRFVVGVAFNLLLAGALFAFGREYATARVEEITEDPGGAFVWGLGVGIGVPVLLGLLALTIVGLVVAIPGLLLLAGVSIVGNAVAIVWIGSLVAGQGARLDWAVVGAGALIVAAVGAIPVLGNFGTSLLGLFGVGVVGRRLYRSWRGEPSTRTRPRSGAV